MDSNDIRSRLIEEELRSVWPGWHVARRLGGGSFGDVFQIYRDNYGIRVDSALKVIQMDDWMATVALPSNSRDENQPNIPDALRSEIQIMEALRGAPNIVSIEDFAYKRVGQTSTLLVRMELLKSLQEVLPGRNGQGTLSSISEITKLGKDVCRALMYCEKRGIIHRDIKPANLFVDRFGDYKVGDFGASKKMETVHVAQTMTGIGTISYMAPEIFRGQSYNNTVDIYALGLVLYQLLNNGRMAFLPDSGAYSTQDIDSANYHRLHGTPVPSLAGKYVGGERIDSRLDAVVRKACAMNPADRYRTAKEFFDALALTEMPEKKAEPEYGRRAQSFPRQAVPVQERQEYRQAGPGQKSAGGTAAASPVQWRQQESEHARAKSGPSAAPRQAASPPPVRSYQSRHQKKGLPGGVIPMVAIVLVCIIVSVALTSLGSRRGGSTGTSSSAPAEEAVEETVVEEAEAPAEKAGYAAAEAVGGDLADKKVGVCIYQFSDNFMTLFRGELERYLIEQGFAKENITIVDGANDQATQSSQIDKFIADGVDVLIINLVNPSSAATFTDKVVAAGIPLVYIDREPDADEQLRWIDNNWNVCYVGCDARQYGTFQGEIIGDLGLDAVDFNKNGKIDYIMIEGDPENIDAAYRTEFSVKALTDAGFEVNCLDDQVGMWDQVKSAELVANSLSQYGNDIEVVFCNNDAMALGALQSIQSAGRKVGTDIYLVGVDALTEVVEYVISGDITGTVFNNYFAQADGAADAAINYLNGAGNAYNIQCDYIKVTKENAQEILDYLQ